MLQIQSIRLMNESKIIYLKQLGKDARRNEIIEKILEDDACFFKMKKEDASLILQDIGVSIDKVNSTYVQLISYDNYFKLKSIGKIDEKDESLIVKYEDYNPDKIFKTTKNEGI